jgi:outer membrane protein
MNRSANRSLVGAAGALLLGALTAGAAVAQQAAANAYKIGYVDTARMLADNREMQLVQKNLEAEFQKSQRAIADGPPAEKDRRMNLLAEGMNQRRSEALQVMVEKSTGIIRRIAEAEKFDIVFIEATYVNARIDLTDRVIRELDAAR